MRRAVGQDVLLDLVGADPVGQVDALQRNRGVLGQAAQHILKFSQIRRRCSEHQIPPNGIRPIAAGDVHGIGVDR